MSSVSFLKNTHFVLFFCSITAVFFSGTSSDGLFRIDKVTIASSKLAVMSLMSYPPPVARTGSEVFLYQFRFRWWMNEIITFNV